MESETSLETQRVALCKSDSNTEEGIWAFAIHEFRESKDISRSSTGSSALNLDDFKKITVSELIDQRIYFLNVRLDDSIASFTHGYRRPIREISSNKTYEKSDSSESTKNIESSTSWQKREVNLDRKIGQLLNAARYESFVNGVDSEFSSELTSLITTYGNAAIDILGSRLISKSVIPDVEVEALETLGRMDDKNTYKARLWLLEMCLRSTSPKIRDGAGLAIAWMNDPSAIIHVEQALQSEEIDEVRRNLEKVHAQLEITNR